MEQKDLMELQKLDLAMDQFAAAVKLQLHKKFADGWVGWDNPDFVTTGQAIERLLECANRGESPKDMVNTASFAMFIWHQHANK